LPRGGDTTRKEKDMDWTRGNRGTILESLLVGELPDGFTPEDLPRLGEIAGGKLSLKISPKGHLHLVVTGGSRYGHTLYLREILAVLNGVDQIKAFLIANADQIAFFKEEAKD